MASGTYGVTHHHTVRHSRYTWTPRGTKCDRYRTDPRFESGVRARTVFNGLNQTGARNQTVVSTLVPASHVRRATCEVRGATCHVRCVRRTAVGQPSAFAKR